MRKLYQNTPYFAELETDMFAPLNTSFAAPEPGPLFMETDDFAGDITTTGVVDVTGLPTSGVIETEGDSDWFAVTLTAGQNFELFYLDFEFTGVSLDIYDSSETLFTNTRSLNVFGEEYLGFTADADDTYYVAVTGELGFTDINYSFVGAVYNDDFSADITTTALMTAGESFSGELEAVTDEDWIGIDVVAGELTNISIASSFMDPSLSVYDAAGEIVSGVLVDFDLFDPSTMILSFTPDATARYYISIANGFEGFPGNQYALSTFTDDFSADTSTTGLVLIDGNAVTIEGEHETSSDVDWFAVTLAENQTIEINGDYDFDVSYYDADGNFISPDVNVDNGFGVINGITATTAGTYFVGIESFIFIAQTYSLSGFTYIDDFSGDTSTTGTLEIDGDVSGVLSGYTDTDWFSISLAENERLTITSDLESDGSTYLNLRNEAGGIVQSGYVSGVEGETVTLTYSVDMAGTYFVDVGYDYTLTSITPYTLSATSETIMPDIADDITTTATIAVGETVSSNIENNTDEDWFAFSIADDEAIKFDVVADNGANLDLRIYDANGTSVLYNSGNQVVFDLPSLGLSGGDYFVEVRAYYDGTPSYDLTATSVEPDIAGDTSTTATIALGETVSSQINNDNDSDWFAFSLTEGQVVDFDWVVEDSRSLQYAVYNDQGNYIFDLIYSNGVFAAPEAGNYFVGVSAYYDGLPSYDLTLNELVDDYAGNATTTGLIAGGEQLTVNFEYATDVDWIRLDGEVGEVLRLTHDDPTLYDFYIVDASNNIVAYNYFGNDYTQIYIDFAIPDDSDYFFRLTSDQYVWAEGQTLTVSAETVIDDYIGSIETEAVLEAGATETVRHDFQNDQDWLVIDTSQGGDILLSVTPPNYNGNQFYGTMRIHDEAGNVVQEFYLDQFGTNSYAVSLDVDANYYVSTAVTNDDFGVEYSLSSLILTVNGTDGADTLIGSEIDDTIFGGLGDDTLIGGAGDDALYGSEGRDNLIGGIGADLLNGGGGEDAAVYSTAASGAYVNLLTGLGAARSSAQGDVYVSIENLIGSAFNDSLTGNDGRNDISAGAGDDYVFGGGERDILYGNDGDDIVDGGDGDDILYGGNGADTLTGGDGNDRFDYNRFGNLDGDIITDFSLGYDYLDFTSLLYREGVVPIYIGDAEFTGQRGEIRFEITGEDTLIQLDSDGDGEANEYLTLQNYTDKLFHAGNGDIYGTPRIIGDQNDNSLYGSNFHERFYGLDGNDYIFADGGNDFVDGGNGDDIIYGDIGNDDLNGGAGTDYVYGGIGDDILRGEAGINYLTDTEDQNTFILVGGTNIVFGNNQSVIDFSEASSGAVADLMMAVTNTGAADGDTYNGVDNLTGSDFADRLYGDNDANTIIGGDGNDALFGRNGDDMFIGGDGGDLFSGGSGFDTVDYSEEASAVTVDMMGLIAASQAAQGDKLYSIESVIGTEFNDRIFGNNDGNLIEGGAGNDSLFGRNGDDVINGGDGDDLISAGAHDDALNGGAGNDRLYTGAGNDIVMMDTAAGGNDTVYDFMIGFDTILIDDEGGSFDSFAELMTAGVDNGTDVTFDFGDGNSLTIKGYNLANLSDGDFSFGDVPPSAELIDSEFYASDEFTDLETFDWGAA